MNRFSSSDEAIAPNQPPRSVILRRLERAARQVDTDSLAVDDLRQLALQIELLSGTIDFHITSDQPSPPVRTDEADSRSALRESFARFADRAAIAAREAENLEQN